MLENAGKTLSITFRFWGPKNHKLEDSFAATEPARSTA